MVEMGKDRVNVSQKTYSSSLLYSESVPSYRIWVLCELVMLMELDRDGNNWAIT